MTHSFSHRIGVWSGIFLTALLPLSAASKGTINIGHVTTLTGPNSYIGPGAVAALEDEAARVNAAGGINGWNIKIISYDGQSQPAESVTVKVLPCRLAVPTLPRATVIVLVLSVVMTLPNASSSFTIG